MPRKTCCPSGLKEFKAFTSGIGEALKLFGKIDLLVFVRRSHLEEGTVKALSDRVNNVKCGVNLGIDRAPNKGSVGLCFRIQDSTVAFCSSHLAADSQGKHRTSKRNEDAAKALKGLKLGLDPEEFDLHFMVSNENGLLHCKRRIMFSLKDHACV